MVEKLTYFSQFFYFYLTQLAVSEEQTIYCWGRNHNQYHICGVSVQHFHVMINLQDHVHTLQELSKNSTGGDIYSHLNISLFTMMLNMYILVLDGDLLNSVLLI